MALPSTLFPKQSDSSFYASKSEEYIGSSVML